MKFLLQTYKLTLCKYIEATREYFDIRCGLIDCGSITSNLNANELNRVVSLMIS